MSRYSILYTPAAHKVLMSADPLIADEIEFDIQRRASFAANLPSGNHHKHTVRGSGFRADYTVRHDDETLTVLQIRIHPV